MDRVLTEQLEALLKQDSYLALEYAKSDSDTVKDFIVRRQAAIDYSIVDCLCKLTAEVMGIEDPDKRHFEAMALMDIMKSM
jgi:hypothetical protein